MDKKEAQKIIDEMKSGDSHVTVGEFRKILEDPNMQDLECGFEISSDKSNDLVDSLNDICDWVSMLDDISFSLNDIDSSLSEMVDILKANNTIGINNNKQVKGQKQYNETN